jgi:Ala-tRNA(Pro) deacylase
MSTRRIRDFLTGSGVWYSIATHPSACTAQAAAKASHIPGRYMAKNVIVWIDGQLAMAVVPATMDLNLPALRAQTGAGEVRLADEFEFITAFADCQLGSVPPFGNLFGVKTYVDIKLAMQEQIAFNAGTRTDIVRMSFADYCRLAKPLIVQIAMEAPPETRSRTRIAREQVKRSPRISYLRNAEDQGSDHDQVQCSCESIHHLGAD